MWNFSIVFKNSLQNKKNTLSQVALQQETGNSGRLTVLYGCTTQPEAELALLASAPVISFTTRTAFIPECHFVELEVSPFRKRGGPFREPFTHQLCQIEYIRLVNLQCYAIRLHLEAQNAGQHISSVLVAHCRFGTRRNHIGSYLFSPNKCRLVVRNHATHAESVHNNFSVHTLSFLAPLNSEGLPSFTKNFSDYFIILRFT